MGIVKRSSNFNFKSVGNALLLFSVGCFILSLVALILSIAISSGSLSPFIAIAALENLCIGGFGATTMALVFSAISSGLNFWQRGGLVGKKQAVPNSSFIKMSSVGDHIAQASPGSANSLSSEFRNTTNSRAPSNSPRLKRPAAAKEEAHPVRFPYERTGTATPYNVGIKRPGSAFQLVKPGSTAGALPSMLFQPAPVSDVMGRNPEGSIPTANLVPLSL